MKTIRERTLPVLWLNWFFGMGVFEYPVNHPHPYISAIYILITKSLILTSYYFCILRVLSMQWYTFEKFTFTFIVAVNFIVAVLSTYISWCNSQECRSVMAKIDILEDSLTIFGYRRNYKMKIQFNFIWLFLWIGSLVIVTTVDAFWLAENCTIIEGYFISLIVNHPIQMNSIVDLNLALRLRYINEVFNELNKILVFNLIKKNEMSNSEKASSSQQRKMLLNKFFLDADVDFQRYFIALMRQIHRELCSITRQFNEGYCLQILLELIVHFTQITLHLYNLYFTIKAWSPSTSQNPVAAIAITSWVILFSAKLIIVNLICAEVVERSKVAGQILHEVEVEYFDRQVEEEIRQFSLEMILRPLQLTACGFFTLDANCIRRFFGAVGTYLVIFIQMSNKQTALKIDYQNGTVL